MAESTYARSLPDLVAHVDRDRNVHVRVTRADGSSVEGSVISIAPMELLLSDATGTLVQLPAEDVQAIEVQLVRRWREWAIAIVAVPAVTVALVAYAQLPWVRPTKGYILIGFGALYVIASAIVSIPIVDRLLKASLTRWKRLT